MLLIVGGAIAFIGLGLFLVAIGYEPEPNIEAAAFVDGADLVSSSVGANGGTTWFVVVSPDASDAELTRIATDLVSTPEAAAIDSLEILFFDEAGRDLDEYIEALNELDELSQAEDLDLERILELSSTIGDDWGMEHYVGTVQERIRSDAERFLGLCLEDLVSNCSSGTSIAIEPRN